MRQIRHPGPVAATRTSAIADAPIHLRFTLLPGDRVDTEIAKGFAAAGCLGGVVAFDSGSCDPFQFVIPAASRDGAHAAWYSDVFSPKGAVEMKQCVAIVGERDGKPFLHCHGMWQTSDGLRMGHMLAPTCVVAQPIVVTGLGFAHATFSATYDAETHFTLFEPVAAVAQAPILPISGLLVRVRPNEDVCLALESLCTSHGIASANVFGIGSLNEVYFADGRRMHSHATELLIRQGRVASVDGAPCAHLDIAVVDMEGNISEGEIRRGDNPVCVTFELVIEPLALLP
ncbi:MAG: hypothetical protein K0S56_4151 [Microvirga sp.]|nr:hypothetical protein [Microvirga sp.]